MAFKQILQSQHYMQSQGQQGGYGQQQGGYGQSSAAMQSAHANAWVSVLMILQFFFCFFLSKVNIFPSTTNTINKFNNKNYKNFKLGLQVLMLIEVDLLQHMNYKKLLLVVFH